MKASKWLLRSVALIVSVLLLFGLAGCKKKVDKTTSSNTSSVENLPEGFIASVEDAPRFDGETAFVAINDNQPKFTEKQLVTKSYESYAELDALGRCGVAMASVGKDIMPTEERGSIGQVKPSGWHTVKYDIVDGKYLYNRCHLIGFQLTGENANRQNLITGTRYLNIEGMLPFENMIADYVKETGNHVIYRVTPYFKGDDLVCEGVQLEGYSVEDKGEGVCFNVYAYNAQPGIEINYSNGESSLIADESSGESPSVSDEGVEYVLNTKTKKFHLPDCSSVKDINDSNKSLSADREQIIKDGYAACKSCKP